MKKCPYCAEEIQDEAIICRYCGKDVSEISIKADSRRSEIGKEIAFLELEIKRLEIEVKEGNDKLQQTRKGQGVVGILTLIGSLMLLTGSGIFIGIGFFLVIIGMIGITSGSKEVKKLENAKQESESKLDNALSRLAELKAELAGL